MSTNILTCPVPTNINPLSPNGFRFAIDKLPELTYFCQEASIPGLTLGDPILATPFRQIPLPGDHLQYDTFQVKFMIDENMENYIAIYNWLIALGFPENYTQYVNFISANQIGVLSELAKSYSTATLQILNNTNNPVKTIQFNDMFPVALETVTFQSNNADVNYLIGSATFRFSYYTFSA
jgi:hypothetical protein